MDVCIVPWAKGRWSDRTKVAGIDIEKGTIHIRKSKSLKDRYSFLAIKWKALLAKYLKIYVHAGYLFEGEKGESYWIH